MDRSHPRPAPVALPLMVGAASFGAVALGLFGLRSSWAALLLYHGVIAVSLLARRNPGLDWRALTRGFSLPAATLAAGASILAAAGFYFALEELDSSGKHIGGFVSQMGPSVATMIPFALYASTVNPSLEELFWRGNFADRNGHGKLHDLCYSLFHIPVYLCFAHPAWSILPIAILFGAGLTWRHAARRFGGLAVPVLGHAAGNLGLMIAVAVKLTHTP